MKYSISLVLAVIFFSASCKSTKTTSDANVNNMKANLIDGTWEVNYIMNTPKPFADIYPGVKPSITFNSYDGKVMGVTGCNNFNGTFKMDGNKLSWGDTMATTRKMCPDMTGEQTFLETLKKVNSYSVTEQGKTLNLIMGDMAVMRLTRNRLSRFTPRIG